MGLLQVGEKRQFFGVPVRFRYMARDENEGHLLSSLKYAPEIKAALFLKAPPRRYAVHDAFSKAFWKVAPILVHLLFSEVERVFYSIGFPLTILVRDFPKEVELRPSSFLGAQCQGQKGKHLRPARRSVPRSRAKL